MADKQPIFDGQTDFSGGMDASRSPELINPNQIALGVNVTVRGGYPATRPRWNRLLLDFAGDDEAEAYWNANFYQGTGYFNPSGNTPGLTTSVGGRIFNLQPKGTETFEVTDITPKINGVLDRNSARLSKAYFTQASVYQIIGDGQSLPFIFDGSTVRRSNPNVPEVPVGTVMAYGQSRLAIAFGNQFQISDINGGATNVLSFTETTYLNGGGSFLLPMNMGNVTGMIFIAKQDTNTGQGTLLVFGESGIISVDLSIPREQWQTSQIVTVTLTDIGTLADRSLQNVNGDILFRGKDGLRSYRDARAEFGSYAVGNFGRTPMSYEVSPYLDTDTLAWQPYISAVNFDNRYLMTTMPVVRGGSGPPVFQALAVMDFIPVTALRYNQAPVFDGIWTGLDFYQLVQGKFASGLRCFAFARGVDNVGNQELQLWEITTQQGDDNDTCPIACAIESKSFVFNSQLGYKRLDYLRHWVDQLQGRSDWALRVKPDQYPGWAPWQEWTYEAPMVTCQNTECGVPNYQPQYRAGRNATLSPEGCLTDGNLLWTYKTGFGFQIRMEWEGVARLTKLLFAAQSQDVPKLDCLVPAPPDNPLTAIVANLPPANQYFNQEINYECPAGFQGTPVTVPAGTFSSLISVADANAQALNYAIAHASCFNIPIIAPLIGLSWTLPCTNAGNPVCTCPPGSSDTVTVTTLPTDGIYNVQFRIRGVFELCPYTGGAADPATYWYTGGIQNNPNLNVYRLTVDDPPQLYYINNDNALIPPPTTPFAYSYYQTIQLKNGSTVTLDCNAQDGAEFANIVPDFAFDDDPVRPIVVTQPYNGQFAQIDAETISLAP